MMDLVSDSWKRRKEIYEENLEIQLLFRDMEQADGWLNSRESYLLDPNYGDSVTHVEVLLKKQEDFEKMLMAQAEKFELLRRITKREQNLHHGHTDLQEKEQKKNEPYLRVPSLKRKTSERRVFPPKIFDRGSTKRSSVEPLSPLQSKPADIPETFPNLFDSKVKKPETTNEPKTAITTNLFDLKIPSLDKTDWTPNIFERGSTKKSSLEPLSPLQSKPADIPGTFPNIVDSKINKPETASEPKTAINTKFFDLKIPSLDKSAWTSKLFDRGSTKKSSLESPSPLQSNTADIPETFPNIVDSKINKPETANEPKTAITTNVFDLEIPSLDKTVLTPSQPPAITPQRSSIPAQTYQFSKVPITETILTDAPLISLEDTNHQLLGEPHIKSSSVPTKLSMNAAPFSEMVHITDLKVKPLIELGDGLSQLPTPAPKITPVTVLEVKSQPPTELKLDSPNVPSKTPDLSPRSPMTPTLDRMVNGFMEAKQKTLPGGKANQVNFWNSYYITLREQILSFYSSKKDEAKNETAIPSVSVVDAICEKMKDSEKVNMFFLRATDGSEYVFSAPSARKMDVWIQAFQGGKDESEVKREVKAYTPIYEMPRRTLSFEPDTNGHTVSASRVYITSEQSNMGNSYTPNLLETDDAKEKHKKDKNVFMKFFRK